jgi:hypothetical protein
VVLGDAGGVALGEDDAIALDGTGVIGFEDTALDDTALDGTALDGTALDGTALDGTALDGTGGLTLDNAG